MFTTRPLPSAAPGDDPLLGYYHAELLERWTPGQRRLAAALDRLATRGTRDPRCRALGIPEAEARTIAGHIDPTHYLSQVVRRGIHRLLNPAAIPLAASILKDKRSFAAAVARSGLPAPETYAGPGEAASIAGWLRQQGEIVAKPNFSSRGRGVARYRRTAKGWADVGGAVHDTETLACRLARIVAAGGLLQPAIRTAPYLSDVSPGALPTLRVHTFRTPAGFSAHGLVLRLGGGASPVDNFSRGGLAVPIDADGAAGEAIGKAGGHIVHVSRHPATGMPLGGIDIRDLAAAAVRLGIEAHAAIGAGYGIIGWDIGLADTGAVLIEGNWNPGHQLTQFSNGRGVSELPIGGAYLGALKALPEAAWRTARPLQWDGQYRLGAPELAPPTPVSISAAGLPAD